MTSSSDYARLREQTIGSLQEEEAVTVNTRALIDKVLARYSGEWTTLRELLQNAADARASEVTIRFETTSPIPHHLAGPHSRDIKDVLLHSTLKTLLVTNNGDPFKETDWQRLKRIAEGNPDETKIGAFGVGFYSVFADCESPFVTSGDQSMAFYWKKDSLFTRRVKVPADQATKNTTFVLDYRSASTPVPSLLSLCQFLATSLTFVGLESIKLYLDEWNVLKLTKKMAPGSEVSVPKDVNPKTKDGLMKITSVEYQNAQIDAQWMNVVSWNRSLPSALDTLPSLQSAESATSSLRGWFSKIAGGVNSTSAATKRVQREEELLQLAIVEDLCGLSNATVFLRISTVSVQTFVSKSLAQELERATKKPPPKHTRIAILTSSYDETSASLSTLSGAGSRKASEIFASVLPTKNGKIFIGFPTAQTTGLLAHISAPSVIPTVERESIDLNARHVRDWNIEMLRVAGIACRIAYTGDMQELSAKLQRLKAADKRTKTTVADIDAVLPAAVHAFKQYTYDESTPNARVGQYIEEAFWTCNKQASIDVLSTRGILPSQQVRVATEDLSFVEGIPVVPEEIMQKAPDFLAKLRDYGLLSDITTSDIKKELEAQALSEKQVAELLKWACGKVSRQEMDASAVQALFDGTVAGVDEQYVSLSSSPVIQLGQIQSYVNTSKIPAELPTPPQTMPFRLTKALSPSQLTSIGWDELQIVPWLRWIIESRGQGFGDGQRIDLTPAVASQVLPVISKAWESLSQSSKQTVVELLVPLTVVPTKSGMRKPPQAYFASVKVFDDLPTIVGLQGVKEKFLFALGVRKTVELNVVFDRLMAKSNTKTMGDDGKATSSHVDLIKYLVSVKDDIPVEDIKRLRDTPICSAEPLSGDQTSKGLLYRLSDLYEPSDAIRRLGLPVLQWPGLFRPQSPEGRFLKTLGLRPYPDVPALVDILNRAPMGSDLQQAALQYFVVNCFHHGYNKYPVATIDKAFLPVLPFPGEKSNLIAKPNQCYADPKASILRFRVLREDLQSQHAMFGVAMHPAIDVAAERLVKAPPLDIGQARLLFGYFAGRLNEIGPSGNLAEKLGLAPIVPISSSEKHGTVRFVAPRSVYLGDSANYGDIFDFVDFGAEANAFLLRVGSTHEPSATEIAQLLVKQPGRLLQTLGTDKYLQLLRRVAENAAVLKKDKAIWSLLRSAPCLLAVKEVIKTSPGDSEKVRDFDEEELTIKEYSLASAPTMVIADDFATYRLFQSDLVAAPQEETLEGLYAALETPYLSKLVQDEQRMGQLLRDQSTATKLQTLIVERCRLFLHDQTEDQIRHDARWLEQNMNVKATEFLQVTRRLKGYRMQFMEKRSAALHRESRRDATLFVTSRCDLYEVSRALMPLLLKRPRQQDYLALEILMESDLGRLKRKGYNVDRILRAKAAESRIAESERQKRDEEQKSVENATRTMALSNGLAGQQQEQQQQQRLPLTAPPTPPPSQQARIPGAFNESPSPEPHSSNSQLARPTSSLKPSKSLFGNLTRQLGLSSSPHTASSHPSPSTEKKVLKDAIAATRPFDDRSLATAAQTKDLATETPTYCDSTPATDIVRLPCPGTALGVFVSRSTANRDTFLNEHAASIQAFAHLLRTCAQIFSLDERTLNIYYEPSGSGIAFNSRQSIFCNLRFFEEGERDEGKALVYWFVTLCHELAHNLVHEHGQAHSFHTESFMTEYMARLVEVMR